MWKIFICIIFSLSLINCATEKQVVRKKAKKFPKILILPEEEKVSKNDQPAVNNSEQNGLQQKQVQPSDHSSFQENAKPYPLITPKISHTNVKKKKKPVFKAEQSMKVHVIDVGQGAATLLEFPCGVILVDTGGEKSSKFKSVPLLEKYLRTFFKKHPKFNKTLDSVIITHSHIDHMRGLPMLLSQFKVKTLIDGGRSGDRTVSRQQRKIDEYFEKNEDALHLSVRSSDIGDKGLTNASIDPFKCSKVDPKITILHAAMDSDPGLGKSKYGKKNFENENNHSLVTRVDFGESSLLITGDLEEEAIELFVEKYHGSPLLDVDLYQVGHHGSANGSTRPLLEALSPRLAVIPMGKAQTEEAWTAWKYGHPRLSIIDILQDTVIDQRIPPSDLLVASKAMKFSPVFIHRAIYGTGWDGNVVIEMGANDEYLVQTENQTKTHSK